ncbi:beta-ketoacyl synthase N-terminal-like domain-containing protein [Nocardia sp. NPDC049220]|uniref:beta-ketoacyl synthase N-terminal-like domain-containing protein n=1 Tax=Nocardia sp. NPDC049220 TaxID=3155273 RepID=UPI0033F77B46
MFEPVAVVGRGCVLPDALTPDSFWHNVVTGRLSVSTASADRWRLPDAAMAQVVGPAPAPVRSAAGGYVHGFDDIFEPDGFLVGRAEIAALDPSFRWVLHGAREALREAGEDRPRDRTGLVLGNLSMPTDGLVRYAESVWLAEQPELRAVLSDRPAALDRFSSAMPAHFAAAALGLGGGAFALDAACASALYAIKLACDRLHARTADVMVAGAVNRVDDLAVHLAFSALGALSPTGRSRPFHRGADGLVPAEGCGFVALMRLSDALAANVRVFGVIRGIGLSNDGRGAGLLVPSQAGQLRAIQQAYAMAGVAPESVSLLECHATGTPLGDTTEVHGMADVFGDASDLPIGSVKSNTGHLVTAAGVAGLLKVLSAFEATVRPPTLSTDDPVDALRGTPLRLLREAEPWDGPRRAGISAFGFGGNNAHLVLDPGPGDSAAALAPPQGRSDGAHSDRPDIAHGVSGARRAIDDGVPALTPQQADSTPEPDEAVAIVAIGARVGTCRNYAEFRDSLLRGISRMEPATEYDVELDGLRTPPVDLREALGQQVAVLEAAREAAGHVVLPRERTTVLIGMGCDPQVARHPARVRVAAHVAATEGREAVQDAFAAPLAAPAVLGTMPNIVANRINSQLDLGGPGFTVSAEEASGIVALELGCRALYDGSADAVLVGAVDLSHEPVHRGAAQAVGIHAEPGDAAVVLVLKRVADARRDGDTVLAVVGGAGDAELVVGDAAVDGAGLEKFDPAALFGVPHAAKSLLAVACAAVALRHRAVPRVGRMADPSLGIRLATVAVETLGAPPAVTVLTAADAAPWNTETMVRQHIYSGVDAPSVLAAARTGVESDHGPARLVVTAEDAEQLATRITAAQQWLDGRGVRPEGVAFRERPVEGEVAFVYTNGSACYPRMGRDVLLAFPDIVDRVQRRCGPLRGFAGWAYTGDGAEAPHVLNQIWGASLLGQVHTELTRGVLGLEPAAVLGYSSGETNSLVAMGVWREVPQLVADADRSPLFTREVAGDLETVRRAWRAHGIEEGRWTSYLVNADAGAVRAALRDEPTVRLMAISAPEVCVLGGEAQGCARVLATLSGVAALPLGYDIAVHIPEVEQVRDAWWRLHDRPTTELPDVRFYSCATASSYTVSRVSAADAITEQAIGTIDFVATVEKAWADGVQVFIEHGPRALCTGWISQILGNREHLAVALDSTDGQGQRSLIRAVAELRAAGIGLRHAELFERLRGSDTPARSAVSVVRTVAHPPPVIVPNLYPAAETMAPAPALPPVSFPALLSPQCTATTQTSPPAADFVPFTPSTTAPLSPPVAAATRASTLFAEIAQVHRRFLEDQGAMHQHYLAVAAHAQDLLLRPTCQLSRSASPSSRPSPAAPMSLPVSTAPALVPSAALSPPPLSSAAPRVLGPPATLPALRAPTSPPSAAVSHVLPSPATPPPPPAPTAPRRLPSYDRAQLEALATGPISAVLGPFFRTQDGFRRQVRMPAPPMLLTDRIAGIDAEQGRLGTGAIHTQTDVTADSWYLDPAGRMPAGLMIEAGQSDLLLISWMGIDLLNRGERVYRLLGCEVTFYGAPPVPGETLTFDIHIDGHGEQGGMRLFFFHYDCHVDNELRLSVRGGQAGFFSDAELAASRGVLWDPASDEPDQAAPCDPPVRDSAVSAFSAEQVAAFADGRPEECFGPGWRRTRAHVRTPRIADSRMLFLHEITEFAPRGGPWRRGYLRATTPVSPGDWYFDGHFKDDPCMPGTLMLEGCLQAMAFYLAALGHTIDADGYRYEPVTDLAIPMRCRGQVTLDSREIVYEVFVAEISGGSVPTLIADVLCTVDGVKAFHARRAGLRLVPDWPLAQLPSTITSTRNAGTVAADQAALLASALGRPSAAFGSMYAPFDGTRRAARLPGPPYQFVSRIMTVDAPPAAMRPGTRVVAEYDVPPDAWYWNENGYPVMPMSVLMEVALQPCGWLASYAGCALSTTADLLFRNLDGVATVLAEVTPATPVVRTTAILRDISTHAGMIIVAFDLACDANGTPVLSASTVFGFFPRDAFADQVGLPATSADRANLVPAGDPMIEPDSPLSSGPTLRMWDRITAYHPTGGPAGLGRIVAEKEITGSEWYFRSHFFQDPVQPGSLGVEAMIRLLRFVLNDKGSTAGSRFESVALDERLTWKYRGQVTPDNSLVTIELTVSRIEWTGAVCLAVADAALWVDGTKIYQVPDLSVRLVAADSYQAEEVLDPVVDDWVGDHCPTWTVPALPLMSTMDRMFAAARKLGTVCALREFRIQRWTPVPGTTKLRTEVQRTDQAFAVTASLWREAKNPALSRFEQTAVATLLPRNTEPRPAPWPDPADLCPAPNPYTSGALSHGPRFQYLVSVRSGPSAAVGVLDAARGSVPRGELHQGLLDACTHVIPHAELWRWSPSIDRGQVGYPHRITVLNLYDSLPAQGELTVRARFAGFEAGDHTHPAFDVQVCQGDRVLAAFHLVDALVPAGPLAALDHAERRAFLRDRAFVAGTGLSRIENGVTRLTQAEVDNLDWLTGTVAQIYALDLGVRGHNRDDRTNAAMHHSAARLAQIAMKDHIGRRLGVHPSEIDADVAASCAYRGADVYRLEVTILPTSVVVRDA